MVLFICYAYVYLSDLFTVHVASDYGNNSLAILWYTVILTKMFEVWNSSVQILLLKLQRAVCTPLIRHSTSSIVCLPVWRHSFELAPAYQQLCRSDMVMHSMSNGTIMQKIAKLISLDTLDPKQFVTKTLWHSFCVLFNVTCILLVIFFRIFITSISVLPFCSFYRNLNGHFPAAPALAGTF